MVETADLRQKMKKCLLPIPSLGEQLEFRFQLQAHVRNAKKKNAEKLGDPNTALVPCLPARTKEIKEEAQKVRGRCYKTSYNSVLMLAKLL